MLRSGLVMREIGVVKAITGTIEALSQCMIRESKYKHEKHAENIVYASFDYF